MEGGARPAARKVLRAWLEAREKKYLGSPWLFPGASGEKPLTECAAWRVVKKYVYRARIPGLHPHTLRHTCATNMLRAGADLVTGATALGYSRLDTVMAYTKPKVADMEKALKRAEA